MQKKVAFLIGSLACGGTERVVSNLSLYLEDDIERYIVINSLEVICYPYKGELIRIEPCNRGGVLGGFRKLYWYFTYLNAVKCIEEKYGISVFVSFLAMPNLLNLLACHNGKKILSVRNFPSKNILGFGDKVTALLSIIFYKRADVIAVVSQGIKNDLVKNFRINEKKIKVIYNPLDVKNIRTLMEEPLEKEFTPIFNCPVIINVGRFTPLKGQIHLIRAFSEVKKKQTAVKLVFIGNGELDIELKNIVKELHLEGDVFFLGHQKNPFKFIKKSTVFVLASTSEGFPNALVEAMACGIPVISTDCRSGPREILSPESDVEKETTTPEYAPYGILTPVCDEEILKATSQLSPEESIMAQCINELLENGDLQEKYSILAEKRARDFRLEVIIAEWEKIMFDQ